MARNKAYTVKYRRKRNSQTDYKYRLRLLKSRKPRLVIRKFLNNTTAQIIEYNGKGDEIVASAYSKELRNYGWKAGISSLPSAYLLGLLIGKKALSKKINFCIADIGLNPSVKGSLIYAVLKGALDAGLEIPHNEKILPDDKRICGNHIEEYAKRIKKTEIYQKQFSSYIKNNVNPEDITKEFEKIKAKILEK